MESTISSPLDALIDAIDRFEKNPQVKIFDTVHFEQVKMRVESSELSAYLKEAKTSLIWARQEARLLAQRQLGVNP